MAAVAPVAAVISCATGHEADITGLSARFFTYIQDALICDGELTAEAVQQLVTEAAAELVNNGN